MYLKLDLINISMGKLIWQFSIVTSCNEVAVKLWRFWLIRCLLIFYVSGLTGGRKLQKKKKFKKQDTNHWIDDGDFLCSEQNNQKLIKHGFNVKVMAKNKGMWTFDSLVQKISFGEFIQKEGKKLFHPHGMTYGSTLFFLCVKGSTSDHVIKWKQYHSLVCNYLF